MADALKRLLPDAAPGASVSVACAASMCSPTVGIGISEPEGSRWRRGVGVIACSRDVEDATWLILLVDGRES